MAIRHLVFDIDGTLLDTRAAFLGALETALEKKNAPRGDLTPYYSLPLAETARAFGFTPEEFRIWNDDYVRRLSGAPLYDGVRELIVGLAENVRLALVTSRLHNIADVGLKEAGLAVYFDKIIAADDVAHPKPAADPLNAYAAYAGCGKDEMAFVGDSVNDLACANNAGVRFFAPAWAKTDNALLPYAVTAKELRERIG